MAIIYLGQWIQLLLGGKKREQTDENTPLLGLFTLLPCFYRVFDEKVVIFVNSRIIISEFHKKIG